LSGSVNSTTPDILRLLVWGLLPATIIGVSWFSLVLSIAKVHRVEQDSMVLRTLLHRALVVRPAQLSRPLARRDLGAAWVFLVRTRKFSLSPWIVVVAKNREGGQVADKIQRLFGVAGE
jgi:hypothetical protein